MPHFRGVTNSEIVYEGHGGRGGWVLKSLRSTVYNGDAAISVFKRVGLISNPGDALPIPIGRNSWKISTDTEKM